MSEFKIITEGDDSTDDAPASDKKALVNLIATNLYKYINSDSYDSKSLIMLVAALSVLNTSDDSQAVATARRLAVSAMARRGKKD